MTLHRGFYAEAGDEPLEYSMISKLGWTQFWTADGAGSEKKPEGRNPRCVTESFSGERDTTEMRQATWRRTNMKMTRCDSEGRNRVMA